MIRSIHLRNFKCFDKLELIVPRLTTLAGLNGAGKSTAIQSILCLLQSTGDRLSLNADLVHLGTAHDVLYEYAEEDEIGITVDDQEYVFECDRRDANELPLKSGEPPIGGFLRSQLWQYLNCERTGPRSFFNMSDSTVRERRQLGNHGEYTAHFLNVYGDENIEKIMEHYGAASSTLRDQVDAWMSDISPGVRLSAVLHPEMDIVRLEAQYVDERVTTNKYRTTNIGFGVTFTLPIVVSALAAKPGTLLMVENPEAHLHPKGQTKIGDLLCRAASRGVQVIVESHSDHLLNGIRLGVKNGILKPEETKLCFFERLSIEERFVHRMLNPQIDADGRLDQWPKDYFDEWERTLVEILKPKA